jgi:hypothetical protein
MGLDFEYAPAVLKFRCFRFCQPNQTGPFTSNTPAHETRMTQTKRLCKTSISFLRSTLLRRMRVASYDSHLFNPPSALGSTGRGRRRGSYARSCRTRGRCGNSQNPEQVLSPSYNRLGAWVRTHPPRERISASVRLAGSCIARDASVAISADESSPKSSRAPAPNRPPVKALRGLEPNMAVPFLVVHWHARHSS